MFLSVSYKSKSQQNKNFADLGGGKIASSRRNDEIWRFLPYELSYRVTSVIARFSCLPRDDTGTL